MKILAVVFAVLVLAMQIFGQTLKPEQCTLTLKDAPVLRGIKLGATPGEIEQVLKIKVPVYSTKDAKPFGVSYFSSTANRIKSPLEGVLGFSLSFLNNKLYEISIIYDDSVKWDSVSDFSKNLSDKLKLPNAWQAENGATESLTCKDFKVVAQVFKSTILILTDQRAVQTIVSRKNDLEETKRRDFKP